MSDDALAGWEWFAPATMTVPAGHISLEQMAALTGSGEPSTTELTLPLAAPVHCLHWRDGAVPAVDCCRCGARDVSLQAAGVPMPGPVRACADGPCVLTR